MRIRRFLCVLVMIWLLVAGVQPAAADLGASGAAACESLSWLAAQQGLDGSFGFHLANGAYQPSASVTADVVYVLSLLGEDPAGSRWTREGRSALAALAALAPGYVGTDAGQAGKVARAVALAGADPYAFAGMDLVTIITSPYDPSTGRYHPALLFRHTLAIEGLLRSGMAVPQAAWDALLDAQLPDGGWFWSFDGTQSDIDTTGRVLQLLAGQSQDRMRQAYDRAAALLGRLQATGGGWGADALTSPNGNSTALAVSGLAAAGFDPDAPQFRKQGRGALETLLSFQEATGAFVYIPQPGKEEVRLMATLDALAALAHFVDAPLVCGEATLLEGGAIAGDDIQEESFIPSVTGIYLPLILVL